MKNNILGIILLALLIVGSSDVMAATVEEQKQAAVLSAVQCSAVFKAYGAHRNDMNVYQAGIDLRKNAKTLAASIDIDPFDLMQYEIKATEKAESMKDRTAGVLPPETAHFCTGVYNGAEAAVARL